MSIERDVTAEYSTIKTLVAVAIEYLEFDDWDSALAIINGIKRVELEMLNYADQE